MEQYELCMHRYKRLIELLEDDYCEISRALDGDMLESYRAILKREKEILEQEYKSIYSLF